MSNDKRTSIEYKTLTEDATANLGSEVGRPLRGMSLSAISTVDPYAARALLKLRLEFEGSIQRRGDRWRGAAENVRANNRVDVDWCEGDRQHLRERRRSQNPLTFRDDDVERDINHAVLVQVDERLNGRMSEVCSARYACNTHEDER